jgi:hypothetical protein
MEAMEKVVRIFKNPEDAEAADREFYRSLTGEQRIQMALEIIWKPYGDSPPRFERTVRKVRVRQD